MSRSSPRSEQAFKRVEFKRLIRAAEEMGLEKYTVSFAGYTVTVDKTKPAPAAESKNEWDELAKTDAA